MKKIIKGIIQLNLILLIALIISIGLSKVNILAFAEREFNNGRPPLDNESKDFDDLVGEGAYLGTEQGQTFFDSSRQVLEGGVFWGNMMTSLFLPSVNFDEWDIVNGYRQYGPIICHYFNNTSYPDLYDYNTIKSWDSVLKNVRYKMCIYTFLWNQWGEYAEEGVPDNRGEGVDTLYLSGKIKYIHKYTKTEMNNAMAYILADCDDNTVEPPDSYVNTAFWNFLSGSGSNSGSSGQNSVDTSNISSNLTRYENKLKNNQDLSKSEIKNLIKWLNYLSDNKRTSAYKIMSDYENFDDKNYDKTEKQKKKLKQQLYNKIINNVISEIRNALSNQSSVSVKSLGLIQAAQDFENMHREIGGDYKSKIYDRTNPKNITVEYNAQTKKYLVGPFKIQYIERYINGEQFAGMTGKPILELKKNNVQVNYELGNRWNFVYKNARMAGFPNNTYPHSNEEFYISLDYIEGINQIIGIKFDFRYLTASAQWSYSDGKAEMLKLRLILMGNYLYSPDGQDCKGPLCDAGKADYGSEVGERQYHHYTEDPLFTTNIHYHDSPCKPCSGHDTNGDGVIDTYHYNELDENGNWKTGPYDANKTYAKCSPCQGHKCTIPEPCEHGFYGGHVIDLGFKYVVIPSGEIDISDVATVQSARRGYAGLSWTLGNPPGGNPPDGGGNPSWTIDLTTTMAGNVWEEIDSQKDSNGIIGTKDDEEANKGLENIAVTVKLYDEDGNFVKNGICHKTNGEAVKWPIYTDNNGYYEINRLEAPGVDGTENKLFYVVEFEYDGQTYKHTVYMANPNSNVNNVAEEGKASNYTAKVINNITGEIEADKYKNSSMAVEEVNDRYKFDRTFGEITGNSSVYEENGEYKTAGITKTTDYYGKNGRDNTNDKYNQLSYKGKKEGNLVNSVFESPYTDSSNQLGNSPAKVSDLDKDVTKDEYERYRMVASTYYDDTSRHGLTLDINDYRLKFPLEGWTYILNNKSIEESRDAQGNITRISKRYIADYMLHINLGLQKRKEADISVLEDLYKITLTVNGQKVTKEMDKLDTEANYTQAFDNLNSDMMYSLGLYKADVQYTHKNRYQNAIDIVKELKEGTELRVFVTYKTKVFNNSDTNDVEINELTNYYDPTFTLLNTNVAVPIINENMKLNKNTVVADEPYCRIIRQEMAARGFKPTKAEDLAGYENKQNTELTWDLVGTENGYKVAKLNKLSETKLKAGETVEIFTTYEIDKEGYEAIKDTEENDLNIIEGLREKLLGNKFNTVEISNYSTYYSEEDVDKEPYYTAYSKDKQLLWVSGRIDKDSAPNNIDRAGVMNKEKYEDDTSQSYVLDIKFKTNDREAFGYVWEDEKKEDVTIKDDVNVKVGDGQYQETEKLIPNVKVSMYEVINLTDIGDRTLAYDGLEYYYKIPNQFYTPDGSTNDVYTKGENR